MGTKLQLIVPAEEQDKAVAKPERLFHEINLLHLEGHYFTFDPKGSRAPTNPLKEIEERFRNPEANNAKPITIEPHPTYGAPSVFAYKVFQAIIKKLSDYGYPAPESVSFGNREIMRLIGRASYGGKDSRELVKILNQLRHTAINCWLYNKSAGEAANLSLSLATTFLYTYKKRGQISRFTIYLHPFIIKSINDQYTFCLNFKRVESLEPIGSALFKHLYFHFSNIYSQKRLKDFTFRKDYADICRTWLGGLRVAKFQSFILRDQLGRHLEAVKKTHLIKSYSLEKNATGDGFNIIFHPGSGFFEDYERFYNRQRQSEMQFTLAADKNAIQEPQEIVLHFQRQLNGDADTGIEFGFSEKETLFASSLLEKHGVEEVKAFIDYGLAEARKTNFDIRSLGGLKKYYAPYTQELAKKAKAKVRDIEDEKKRAEDRRRRAYEAYRVDELARLRATLPSFEIEHMEKSIRDELEATHPGTKVFAGWIHQRVNQALAENHPILSFEEWQSRA
jgi:hypothetical protein